MKYNDILQETILDTNIYGYFIDVKNKTIIPVFNQIGHETWLKENIETYPSLKPFSADIIAKINTMSQDDLDYRRDMDILYDAAYKAKLVPWTNPNSASAYTSMISGYKQNISQAISIIWGDLQYMKTKLYVTGYNGLDMQSKRLTYDLPAELEKLYDNFQIRLSK